MCATTGVLLRVLTAFVALNLVVAYPAQMPEDGFADGEIIVTAVTEAAAPMSRYDRNCFFSPINCHFLHGRRHQRLLRLSRRSAVGLF